MSSGLKHRYRVINTAQIFYLRTDGGQVVASVAREIEIGVLR